VQSEVVRRRLVGISRERGTVECQPFQDQTVAIEHQGGIRRSAVARADSELRDDSRRLRRQIDVELDLVDQVVGRAVVFEPDDRGILGAHRNSL
jgi:hypothetical protein